MAGGKETPRQKMIGMMYLFLTAMLALNVSKDILNSFVLVNDSLTNTVENFNEKNRSIYDEFEKQASMNEAKVGKWNDLAKEVRAKANDISKVIDDLKVEVVKTADGEEAEAIVDGKVVASNIDAKDNQDIGGQVLVLGGKGDELRKKVDEFRDLLLSNIDEDHTTLRAAIEKNLNTDNPPPLPDGTKQSWVSQNFEHIPLVGVVTMLTKLQTDIRNSEADIVRYFYGQISASDFKFNKLTPVVIPKSSYVLRGGQYEAEVFIAAQDTTQQPRIFIGDVSVDENGNIVGAGDSLPIVNGKGQFKVPASSLGEKTWGGLIAMTAPDGSIKTYNFEEKYEVAQPTAIISASANKVFYYGVPNPLEVSVPGLKESQVRATATNADIVNYQGGKAIKPRKKGGKITVSAYATIDGQQKLINSSTFSVKQIPPPVPRLKPLNYKGGSVPKAEMQIMDGMDAVLEGFIMENIKYDITSYTVSTVVAGGFTEEERVTGSRFTNGVRNMISKAKRNQRITFDEIKAKGPDGVKELGAMVFKID
jgi:gliding motility-associated protein GldM